MFQQMSQGGGGGSMKEWKLAGELTGMATYPNGISIPSDAQEIFVLCKNIYSQVVAKNFPTCGLSSEVMYATDGFYIASNVNWAVNYDLYNTVVVPRGSVVNGANEVSTLVTKVYYR